MLYITTNIIYIYIYKDCVFLCFLWLHCSVYNDVGYKSIAVYQGILISKVFCIKVGSEALI